MRGIAVSVNELSFTAVERWNTNAVFDSIGLLVAKILFRSCNKLFNGVLHMQIVAAVSQIQRIEHSEAEIENSWLKTQEF